LINEIKCLSCLTDSGNTGKFYIPGCDIKRDLDNVKEGLKEICDGGVGNLKASAQRFSSTLKPAAWLFASAGFIC